MSHIIQQKPKLLARIRRLKGQLEAVERLLESDAPCAEILNLVASARGAMSGLTAELIEDHIREHIMAVADPGQREQGAAELIEVVRTYLK
ncbi:MAG: transcriptional repressor RcnR [Devosia sp.]|nr:transcriptional repressor RcnR [Devosia sp.]